MFAQALEEEKEKEEGEDAQQVFKITFVTLFFNQNVWFGENLDSPKAGWRGGDGCC